MKLEEPAKSRLGRGLAALIGDIGDDFGGDDAHRGTRRIPIEFLRRNPRNPRTQFGEAELAELADSIRERGIIQPIVVRALRELPDVFEIVAGERRWRAAQRAGLHDVPVVIVEADDRLALELTIIENVQRSDLNPIDEAGGYERLVGQYGYTQTDLATTLGKSRSHVANTLRLLKLPSRVRDMMGRGEISAGHGRALLAVDDPEIVADRIVERGLTVRDIERLGRAPETKSALARGGRPRAQPAPDADTRALEQELVEALGLAVEIRSSGESGEIRLRYSSLEQLDALCRALRASAA